MHNRVAAIVVTYNRCELLRACLERLLNQDESLDHIFVVDNASTDGTSALLAGYQLNSRISHIRSSQNLGGAYGFNFGIKHVIQEGYDWIWLMDDDALPDIGALSALLAKAKEKSHIYASVASDGNILCWPVQAIRHGFPDVTIYIKSELRSVEQVDGAPFLGFLFHRQLVSQIGLPDADFFLSGDDMEYCIRARKQGIRIFLVKASHISHPVPKRHILYFMRYHINVLCLPPWKRYYDVRNRLLIAKRHYGIRLWTQTIPGLLLRWIITGRNDPNYEQSKAFLLGIIDGLLGQAGKRWPPPGDKKAIPGNE